MNLCLNGVDGCVVWKHEAATISGQVVHVGTTCRFINELQELYVVASTCHPKDNFCKSKGRKITLGRLLKAAKCDVDARRAAWETYFLQFPIHKKAKIPTIVLLLNEDKTVKYITCESSEVNIELIYLAEAYDSYRT